MLGLAKAAAPVIQQHLNELLAAAAQYGVPTVVQAGTGGQAAHSRPWSPAALALAVVGLVLVLGAGLHRIRTRKI